MATPGKHATADQGLLAEDPPGEAEPRATSETGANRVGIVALEIVVRADGDWDGVVSVSWYMVPFNSC